MPGFKPLSGLPSLLDGEFAGFGFLGYSFDPLNQGANTAPTAGTIYASACAYRAGMVLQNTVWWVNTAGVGTVPTSIFTGICDVNGRMLAQSGNDKSNTGWATATNYVPSPLSSKIIIPSTGVYYNVFLQVGSWTVTQHTLFRSGSISGNFPTRNAPLLGGTGQTALPATGADLTLTTAGAPLRYWTTAT